MISLFRKIRQKLLAENRVTRYLVYALGEILLVTIGILIALQFNTWKEERANHAAEINFYQNVLSDLEKDKLKMENQMSFYTHRIEVVNWLMTRIRNPQLEFTPLEFGQHVEPLYYNETSISFDATFDAAKSSGAFDKFSNPELLNKMIQYYSEFKQLEEVVTSSLRLIEFAFEPLMATTPKDYLSSGSSELVIAEGENQSFYEALGQIKETRQRNTLPELRQFLQNPEFESYLVGDLGRAFHSLARMNTRLSQIDSLKNEINQFLHD